MFTDYVALAFHHHVIHAYGDVSTLQPGVRGGLASWQMRRVSDFIDANLDADPSISQLAGECGLSAGYFARAFKQSAGLAPHQWLTRRRLDKARELLQANGLALDRYRVDLRLRRPESLHARVLAA